MKANCHNAVEMAFARNACMASIDLPAMQNRNPANLFTPGASSDPAPHGDAECEAVVSLRGYAYQVAAATGAWLDVPDHGRVYLEVAEDYATVARQILQAVQVKDTAEQI